MNILKIFCSVVLLSSIGFAQETIAVSQIKKEPLTQKQFLDSIKTSFVRDNIAACIDSMWMKKLANLDLYDEMTMDIENLDVDKKVDYDLPTDLLKARLKLMDEKSPFNIEYNVGLENVIKSFLKNRKKGFERLMGISQYYFPMFEEALAAQNIPLEIKYLAVVESALNPRAVSKAGATGLWQFMYQTGKQYNLNIDTYKDDRSDPIKASKAATQYMKNMYAIFGDWDLVLASYNTGPGNVAKAIRRSGGKQNYWNIRPYLHKETQGYLPAFLATMYIFEYHKEHGIVPNKPVANLYATDTIQIKSKMTFKQISDLMDVSVAELQFLNPAYKRDVVPFITGENHYLRLPSDKTATFVTNEEKIYAYINYADSFRERPYTVVASNDGNYKTTSRVKYHKVKRGETLSEIANDFNVAMSDIKKWNKLRSNRLSYGRNLKIYTEEAVAVVEKKSEKPETAIVKETKIIIAANGKNYTEEKVVSYKDVVKYHKVKRGESLGLIANKYDVSVSEVKKWNKLKGTTINSGANLKIVKNERVVSIVKKEVKQDKIITTLDEENQVASTDDEQLNPKDYYEVKQGDNLLSIAKKFDVSLEDLKEWNNLEDSNIQSGEKLALLKSNTVSEIVAEKAKSKSIASKENIQHYYVKKGDSLFSISQKYPGVSIADLKKWNDIKNESIKPGMKLRING